MNAKVQMEVLPRYRKETFLQLRGAKEERGENWKCTEYIAFKQYFTYGGMLVHRPQGRYFWTGHYFKGHHLR